ncbi:MAG: bacteriohemerythrin [Spirochaetes bacterium]|nr:bacteriohemerythrin [Spirochaetota bacterium]
MSKNHEIEWQDGYSVGSVLIDNQHKELVAMTNALLKGCDGSDAAITFLRTVQNAVNYVKIHFATEERFMQKVNYPEYAAHNAEHDQFTAEVLRQIKKFEEGTCVPLDFALFLKDWLLTHIADSDKKFVPHFKNIEDKEFAPSC